MPSTIRISALLALFTCALSAPAQQTPAQAAHAYTTAHQPELLRQFEDFVSIPDVAADPANLRRNADFLLAQLRQRGLTAQLLTAPGLPATIPPIVFGELRATYQTPATRTIVFYAHYDGQPVTPSEWSTGQPFTPMLKDVEGEPRLYARAAADDKASIFAQLTALTALQQSHTPIPANIRFVWEGEEEAGSTHLEQILDANRALIRGDIWLVCDGPVDQTRRQTLLFGARGDTQLQITVYGPTSPLHSGHYGNWAPNPALMLAQLLAAMKDESGRVLIPHFYDGATPLGPLELQALAAAPVNDDLLRREFSIGHTEGNGRHLLALYNEPSLNINGIASGQTGAHATNSIPSTATANLDMRLVLGIDWKTQQQRVIDFVQSRGYIITTSEPTPAELLAHPKVARIETTPGENASRTAMDLPIAADVIRTVRSVHPDVILLPTSGATVPLDAMQRASGAPNIDVPIVNHDDNQHAANENLRLQNLWDGIDLMAALIAMQ
jgi:acetylornithine deacetylase/succinyl-diaminopimelate desuccinylase-like protein